MDALGWVAALAVIAVLWLGPPVICFLKGRVLLGLSGLFLFAPLAWVGALLPAKEGSTWASRRERDEAAPSLPPQPLPAQGAPAPGDSPPKPMDAIASVRETLSAAQGAGGAWQCLICGEQAASKGAAEAHVRGVHSAAPVDSSIGPVA